VPATNLTTRLMKIGGTFPATHVATVIQGDAMTPAHGSKDMPVSGTDLPHHGWHSQAQVQLRIRNPTSYLESIQIK